MRIFAVVLVKTFYHGKKTFYPEKTFFTLKKFFYPKKNVFTLKKYFLPTTINSCKKSSLTVLSQFVFTVD
jgi:hypothetical protein